LWPGTRKGKPSQPGLSFYTAIGLRLSRCGSKRVREVEA
jgi:hypothetical protein